MRKIERRKYERRFRHTIQKKNIKLKLQRKERRERKCRRRREKGDATS